MAKATRSIPATSVAHSLKPSASRQTPPIGVAIERLDSARAGCITAAEVSLAEFRNLCSTYSGTIDYARTAKGVTAARHDRALLCALRAELTLLELFAAESELSAAVDVS
ncbi:hypothetical protein SAMN02787142_0710 [Burkholderia sp. WP9]|uniref:hypothetical protein n=1 Tax=Burkholderia sp. WP9 TaxID=1500263 RepID=UPI00089C381B|nr:hypothetical protein [Burkholderia sp. WP9]SEC00740.1 hypothetical protein SAMN02787142_0710 [Burkholderia sp. WP9]